MSEVRVRFAPSPTGPPHVGTVHTGLFNWLQARNRGGKFILRIEDTDREREVAGAYEQILASLRWLGCEWDEGPEAPGDRGPYVQSQRLEIYQEHAAKLLESGAAYKCWCTKERLDEVRARQRAQNMPTGYDRKCVRLTDEEKAANEAAGLPYVIRLRVKREGKTSWEDGVRGLVEFENKLIDDQVLLKADGWPTYHLANVVDDRLMGVNHVIRGEDWISSTPKHLMLYDALGWEPPKFSHLSLLLGPDKSKLSKRHGTTNFLEFVEQGYLPEAMFNFLSILGWSPGNDEEILSKEEIIRRFDADHSIKSGAVFDYEKLKWMNGHYIRTLTPEELTKRCLPFLMNAGLVEEEPTEGELAYAAQVIALEQERLKLLSEVVEATSFFFVEEPAIDPIAWQKWADKPHVPEMLRQQIAGFETLEPWNVETVEGVVRGVIAALGVKAGEVIHPTRVAVSGRTTGPGLFELIAVIGRERILKRLRAAAERVGA